MAFRVVHSRREHECLYSCTLMIRNMRSYEPTVIMPSLSWEESQGDILAIFSGKGFLACTTNLPTHKGKRRGKLDSVGNRDIVQRVSELEAGAGTEDSNLWLHPCHYVSIKLQHQLQLESGLTQTAGWRLFLLGWNLYNTDASWWRLRKKKPVLYCRIFCGLFHLHSKFSRSVCTYLK